MTHDQAMQRAKEAIERVFSDTSVSQETTEDSLDELAELIGMRLEALREDMGG